MVALAKRVAGAVRGRMRFCDHNVGAVFAFACPWCEGSKRVPPKPGAEAVDALAATLPRRVLSGDWRDQAMP